LNFSSHFCQVSQIDLNIMQQYLAHSKKIATLTLKKVHYSVLLPKITIKVGDQHWEKIGSYFVMNRLHFLAKPKKQKNNCCKFVALRLQCIKCQPSQLENT
jgi:hypothetical protein